MLELHSETYTVTVYDESEDDDQPHPSAHAYDQVLTLDDPDRFILMPRYGVVGGQRGEPAHSLLIHAEGPLTRVHDHSALICADQCVVAIGDDVIALSLPDLSLRWAIKPGLCTCFGIYDAPTYASFIVHGECDIARLSYGGDRVWCVSGKDIFTNGFELGTGAVRVTDFNDEVYQIDLATGHITLIDQPR
jgi:hypothetical protein